MRLSIAIPEAQILAAPAVLRPIRRTQASDMETDDLMGAQTVLDVRRGGDESRRRKLLIQLSVSALPRPAPVSKWTASKKLDNSNCVISL